MSAADSRSTSSADAALAGVKVLLCVTGSVAGIKVGELLTRLQADGAACRVAASDKGAVFLEHTQQRMPQGVTILRDSDESGQVCLVHERVIIFCNDMSRANIYPAESRATPCCIACQCDGHAHAESSLPTEALAVRHIVERVRQAAQEGVLHVELARWADILLFAPLSANSLAKLALGLCDNLVTLLARCWPVGSKPLLLAPAMNTMMWEHPVTRGQLATLEAFGARVIPPVVKLLACGDRGVGAMSPVDAVVESVQAAHVAA